jgi:hypothetical protein
VLYKQGANGMMMKCISKDEGVQLLQEIHSGVCGAHSIVGKHSGMDSTGQQLIMMRWKLSPSVNSASSSWSKLQSMWIL